MSKVCILGAGSWGCALAMVLDSNGYEPLLWARRKDQADEINDRHTNSKYLPEVVLSETIKASSDIEIAIKDSEMIVLAVPSQEVRGLCMSIKDIVNPEQIIVNVAKGIEHTSGMRISQIVEETIPGAKYCMLSGPSHAEEVARNIPTALVAASKDINISQKVQDYFMNKFIRIYTNSDLIGVELAGASKNIIAFGAGILDGLDFGDNSKAAMMTRGLTEISRFGVSLGADLSTFSGLSGIGDLIVTCTSMHSRNRRAGILIGQGYSLEETQEKIQMVVEGIVATEAIYKKAKELDIEMPITECIYKVIKGEIDPKSGVTDLMTRSKKHENETIFKL